MRAHRLLARLATAGAMIAAAAGAALIAPGVATAVPGQNYPPPPPALTVSAGSVGLGQRVSIAGVGFARREPVTVAIRYRISLRPGQYGPSIPMRGGSGRSNNQGEYRDRVGLVFPGYATITVRGKRSGKTASATVRVLAWQSPWPRQFRGDGFENGGPALQAPLRNAFGVPHFRYMSNETTLSEGQPPSAATERRGGGADAQLLAGLIGIAGMLSSGLVGMRVARRRRGGANA